MFYSEIYEGFIPKYIFYLFQTINWKKYNTSTGVPSLTSSSIENIEKSFPCYDEQLKVANFLTMIDMRIETQIKIIELKQSLIKDIEDRILWKTTNTQTKPIREFLTEINNKSIIQNQYPLLSSTKKVFSYKQIISIKKQQAQIILDIKLFTKEILLLALKICGWVI